MDMDKIRDCVREEIKRNVGGSSESEQVAETQTGEVEDNDTD